MLKHTTKIVLKIFVLKNIRVKKFVLKIFVLKNMVPKKLLKKLLKIGLKNWWKILITNFSKKKNSRQKMKFLILKIERNTRLLNHQVVYHLRSRIISRSIFDKYLIPLLTCYIFIRILILESILRGIEIFQKKNSGGSNFFRCTKMT